MTVKRSKSDAFMLRLPAGLRDRIKASADAHSRSMNTEIVRVLEEKFPEPWELHHRVDDLLGLVAALQEVSGDEAVDRLTAEMLATVAGIANGRVKDVDPEARKRVKERLEDFMQAQAENEQDRADWYGDDE